MKINKDQKIAVGRALQGVDTQEIAEARIDGQKVDVDAAVAAAAQLAAQAEAEPPTKMRAIEDKLEAKSDQVRERLGQSRAGTWAAKVLSADPELVQHEATLSLKTKDGREIELQIPVVHLKATAMLQKSSIASEVVSFLPFAGFLVPAATSLVSALGSVVADATGQPELGAALRGTAKKHAVLAGVGWIPGVSSATSTLAVLEDRRNLRDLANPSVQAIVELKPLTR